MRFVERLQLATDDVIGCGSAGGQHKPVAGLGIAWCTAAKPLFYDNTALLSFSMASIFTLFGLSPMLLASGYLNPVSLSLALQADPRLAGTASGWSSAISLALAAAGTQLATLLYGTNIAWLIAISGFYAFLCWISVNPAMSGTAQSPGAR